MQPSRIRTLPKMMGYHVHIFNVITLQREITHTFLLQRENSETTKDPITSAITLQREIEFQRQRKTHFRPELNSVITLQREIEFQRQ